MFVNGVTSTFARDSFCKVTGEVVATGKYEASAGVWEEVEFTAVSAATPAEITIINSNGRMMIVVKVNSTANYYYKYHLFDADGTQLTSGNVSNAT